MQYGAECETRHSQVGKREGPRRADGAGVVPVGRASAWRVMQRADAAHVPFRSETEKPGHRRAGRSLHGSREGGRWTTALLSLGGHLSGLPSQVQQPQKRTMVPSCEQVDAGGWGCPTLLSLLIQGTSSPGLPHTALPLCPSILVPKSPPFRGILARQSQSHPEPLVSAGSLHILRQPPEVWGPNAAPDCLSGATPGTISWELSRKLGRP